MSTDLHGLKVPEARAAALAVLKSAAAGDKLRIITGKGVHAKRGQSVVFAAVHKMLKDLGVAYRIPRAGGAFEFTLSAHDLPRIAAYVPDADRPRMLVSNPSNVEHRHWHRSKGRGVDRRKKMARDKQKQRAADDREPV